MVSFTLQEVYSHSNVDVDQVYQVGWLENSDTLSRGYSSERSSLSAAATDNQLIANFNTGAVKHQVVIGAEYHQFKIITTMPTVLRELTIPLRETWREV